MRAEGFTVTPTRDPFGRYLALGTLPFPLCFAAGKPAPSE